jgi:hypothetical protein
MEMETRLPAGGAAVVRTGLLVLVAALALAALAGRAAAASGTLVPAAGTTNLAKAAGPEGTDGVQWPEFPGGVGSDAAPVDRSLTPGTAIGPVTTSDRRAKSNPELQLSFSGINHRQQRLANGGNQFSLEPPDQGLCVGNGYVLETVNDALRVFDAAGNALTPTIALNAFYGYKPAINRATGEQGPFITDPSCLYDAATNRWFHVVVTLEVDPTTGDFLGPNHLDLAVSKTGDPTGSWTIYRVPVENDCVNPANTPCLGDFPHIGADAYGFYITTNSYPFFTNGFDAAWIYAFSKAQLAAGASAVTMAKLATGGADNGNPGFGLMPATSPGTQFASALNGTEYFLSSNAAEEANGNGTSSRILVWALTNTASLNGKPALQLSHQSLGVGTYAAPPHARQKAGDFPLGQCLNIPQCSKTFVGFVDHFNEVEGGLDSSDTRMLTTTYANGKLWGALDTALTVGGQNRAGIEWFVLDPTVSIAGVSASVALQGYTGLAGSDLIYPAIGVTASGRGVMGFTVSGDDAYPSAGYASIDAIAGVGDVHVAAAGLGPQDGFTEYKAFRNPPRWGDYGAAAVDGGTVWIANEFIGQTCTLAQFQATGASCGGTRTLFANWGTRISKLAP